MKSNQGLLVHGAILGVSVALGVGMWLRDPESAKKAATGEVTVWPGKVDDFVSLRFETKTEDDEPQGGIRCAWSILEKERSSAKHRHNDQSRWG